MAVGLAFPGAPVAQAATVSLSVTCSASWTVYDVTAAQGDTVEVTIDSDCYNYGSSGSAYGYVPSSASPSTYFSSYPNPGVLVTAPNNTVTWVVKADAPIGTMSGTGFSNLPYVCSNCSKGAVIRFTITGASASTTTSTTTTVAPSTTDTSTTTLAATSTTVSTTTEATIRGASDDTTPSVGATNNSDDMPSAGTGSEMSALLALVAVAFGLYLVMVSRLREESAD